MLYDNILETIGKTPLVKLNSISYDDVNVFGKLEYFNPSGSVKDRAAYNMILEATSSGAIDKDTVIIEPTSGNTGIGLAMVCAALKMKLILTMPENMSVERIKVLKAYGAEIVLTPKSEGMRGSIEMAERLKARYGHAFIPSQFTNPANPAAHFMHTAKEIFADLNNVSWIVAGIGSGGTIMGIKNISTPIKLPRLFAGLSRKEAPCSRAGKRDLIKFRASAQTSCRKSLIPTFWTQSRTCRTKTPWNAPETLRKKKAFSSVFRRARRFRPQKPCVARGKGQHRRYPSRRRYEISFDGVVR